MRAGDGVMVAFCFAGFFVTLGARYYIKPFISGFLQSFYQIQ